MPPEPSTTRRYGDRGTRANRLVGIEPWTRRSATGSEPMTSASTSLTSCTPSSPSLEGIDTTSHRQQRTTRGPCGQNWRRQSRITRHSPDHPPSGATRGGARFLSPSLLSAAKDAPQRAFRNTSRS
jgi:hypothetical protein